MSAQDELRLKDLFEAYYSGLCDFALYFLEDAQESENVVQQVFVDIWERRDEVFGEKSLKTYLYTAVRNRCLNQLRKTQISHLEDEHIAEEDPTARIEMAELARFIEKLIDQLPTKCRYIFLRSRRDGMTYKEIASELDISVRTVENQIAKALKFLRSKIY
ncbi:MAG: RNA polymerase sigma-70 factor [Flavobacteriales bacterium]|nr:RNA polymerase sigma-70 factor [Flavobacteriales bacterium]